LGIPDADHVLRHVPVKKLFRDAKGNIHGLLPQAFELRPEDEQKLSVNWIEYFKKSTHQENIESTVLSLRESRGIRKGSQCAYGVGNVKVIKDTCNIYASQKVDVVHSGNRLNKSHSSIIRLPVDSLGLMSALAEDVFTQIVKNKDIS